MEPRAGACGLVFQLAAELVEVRVQYVFGKPPVMAHALHVEVFDADVGIIVGKPRGELADVVGSLGGYASVDSARIASNALLYRFDPHPWFMPLSRRLNDCWVWRSFRCVRT